MVSLMLSEEVQKSLRDNIKNHRLARNLTQAGLAKRSGVPLSTLRKFEQQAVISFESFVKLLVALQLGPAVVAATEPTQKDFTTLDELLTAQTKPPRKRGRKG